MALVLRSASIDKGPTLSRASLFTTIPRLVWDATIQVGQPRATMTLFYYSAVLAEFEPMMDRQTEIEKEEENKIEFRDSFDDIEKAHAPCFDLLSFFNSLANIRVQVEAIEKWCCYYEKLAGRHHPVFPRQFIMEISDEYYFLSCCKNKLLFTFLFCSSRFRKYFFFIFEYLSEFRLWLQFWAIMQYCVSMSLAR